MASRAIRISEQAYQVLKAEAANQRRTMSAVLEMLLCPSDTFNYPPFVRPGSSLKDSITAGDVKALAALKRPKQPLAEVRYYKPGDPSPFDDPPADLTYEPEK